MYLPFFNINNNNFFKSIKKSNESPFINNVTMSKVENIRSKLQNLVNITENEKYIIIKNINYKKFLFRMRKYYGERNLSKVMGIEYDERSIELYEQKIIEKKDMKIADFRIPIFFALEVAIIFQELGEAYNVNLYRLIYKDIVRKTWLEKRFSSQYEPKTKVNLNKLNSLKYKPLPFQKEFIEIYPELKDKNNLDGFILTFDQGLGKTLTSTLLSICLDKKQTVIVCPNSLKLNWKNEINSYFDNGKDNVFVVGYDKDITGKQFLVVNNESISKVFPYTKKSSKSMLILDESHNFRNIKGKRTKELLDLKSKLNANDVLVMSGTPIKAVPNEIVPALKLIDPLFDDECADIFQKAFNISSTNAAAILQRRFGFIMWRKTKDEVLDLKEKKIHIKKFSTKNAYEYTIENVNIKVSETFEKIYEEKSKTAGDKEKLYKEIVEKYYKGEGEELLKYYKYLEDYKNRPLDITSIYHEIDINKYSKFFFKEVLINIPLEQQKQATQIYKDFVQMRKQAMGEALGKILPKYRAQMYCTMIGENIKEIISMIENNDAKTVIFSQSLEVVNFMNMILKDNNIRNVKITGETKNRMDLTNEFKEREDTDVLIATSQTLSTGVTLIEANQMFFFGIPWRDADLQQAIDRIYRIGQTSEVNIYISELDTGRYKNLSTRMIDIVNWSSSMFDSVIQ